MALQTLSVILIKLIELSMDMTYFCFVKKYSMYTYIISELSTSLPHALLQ